MFIYFLCIIIWFYLIDYLMALIMLNCCNLSGRLVCWSFQGHVTVGVDATDVFDRYDTLDSEDQ